MERIGLGSEMEGNWARSAVDRLRHSWTDAESNHSIHTTSKRNHYMHDSDAKKGMKQGEESTNGQCHDNDGDVAITNRYHAPTNR